MEPVSIIHLIGSAAVATKEVGQVAYQLYLFIRQAQSVNDTVRYLQQEIQQVGDICEAVGEQLKLLPDEISSHKILLNGIDAQLLQCTEAVTHIKSSLISIRQDSTYFIQHSVKQIKLNLKQHAIDEGRIRIQRCTLNLQVSLQLVNLQAIYLAPKLANEILLDKLEDLHKTLELQGQKLDKSLQQCASTYLRQGTTLYTESVGSNSAIIKGIHEPDTIPLWLSQLETFRLDRPDSLPLFSDHDGDLTPLLMSALIEKESEDIDDEDEDELAVDITEAAYRTGRLKFEARDYKIAETMLHECLVAMKSLTIKQRSYDLEEIHLMLAICTFWNCSPGANKALDTLILAVGRGCESGTSTQLLFEASKLLAVYYICHNKFDLARSTIESMYRAASRLFGKQDRKSCTALALLARLFERQENKTRAELYRSLIPSTEASEAFEAADKAILEVQVSHWITKRGPHSIKEIRYRVEDDTTEEDSNDVTFLQPESDISLRAAGESLTDTSEKVDLATMAGTQQPINNVPVLDPSLRIPFIHDSLLSDIAEKECQTSARTAEQELEDASSYKSSSFQSPPSTTFTQSDTTSQKVARSSDEISAAIDSKISTKSPLDSLVLGIKTANIQLDIYQEDVRHSVHNLMSNDVHTPKLYCSWQLLYRARILTCSYDNSMIACTGDLPSKQQIIVLYGTEASWTRQLTISDHAAVMCLAFDPTGSRLASGHGSRVERRIFRDTRNPINVRVWDVNSGYVLYDIPYAIQKNNLYLRSLRFTTNDKVIVTCSLERVFSDVRAQDRYHAGYCVLDIQTGMVTAEKDLGSGHIFIQFSEDCKRLVILRDRYEISTFNLTDEGEPRHLKSWRLGMACSQCICGPNGTIAVLSYNGTIDVYSDDNLKPPQQMDIQSAWTAALESEYSRSLLLRSCMAFTTSRILIVAFVFLTKNLRHTLYLIAPELNFHQSLVTTSFVHAIHLTTHAERLHCLSQDSISIDQSVMRQWNVSELIERWRRSNQTSATRKSRTAMKSRSFSAVERLETKVDTFPEDSPDN